jgi:flagellar protein FliO/FliZ
MTADHPRQNGRGTLKRYAVFALALAWGVGTLGLVFGQQISDSLPETEVEGTSRSANSNTALQNAESIPNNSQTDLSLSNNSDDTSYQQADETMLSFPESEGQDTDSETDNTNTGYQAVGIADILRMVLVLLLVLAVIYGLYYILKRINKPKQQDSAIIKIRDQVSLGSSRNLYIIEVGGQMFLVGAGDSNFQLITEITDEETKQEIILSNQGNQTDPGTNFSKLLSRWLPRSSGAGSPTQAPITGPGEGQNYDFLKGQRERLKKW